VSAPVYAEASVRIGRPAVSAYTYEGLRRVCVHSTITMSHAPVRVPFLSFSGGRALRSATCVDTCQLGSAYTLTVTAYRDPIDANPFLLYAASADPHVFAVRRA